MTDIEYEAKLKEYEKDHPVKSINKHLQRLGHDLAIKSRWIPPSQIVGRSPLYYYGSNDKMTRVKEISWIKEKDPQHYTWLKSNRWIDFDDENLSLKNKISYGVTTILDFPIEKLCIVIMIFVVASCYFFLR